MKKISAALLLFATFTSSFKSHHKTSTMANTFVLVHGAWQASYAWQKVKQELESKGQKVIVVELPAHGSDQTPPAKSANGCWCVC